MLHPSEYLSLTRGDLILPADALSSDRIAYVRVRNPKTARFARRQHCRLEDVSVLRLLESLFGSLHFDSKIYPGSKATFRSQWNAIMKQFGVPFKKVDRGVTPGVLRGSGATYLYLETEDLSRVAWRGRWARQKTGVLLARGGGAGDPAETPRALSSKDQCSSTAGRQTSPALYRPPLSGNVLNNFILSPPAKHLECGLDL